MDFKNYKCPVCDTFFKDGDDVVVCPECGAPHHRECYEKENRCAFDDKHAEGFDFEDYTAEQAYEAQTDSEDPNLIICPRCNAQNQKGMFYCGNCGFPIGAQAPNAQQFNQNGQAQQNYQNTQTQQNGQAQQNSPFGSFGVPFGANFDPMAGVNPDEDMGDGVTAGELSEYVQKNTPYFIRVFNNIKTINSGRFNLCAFLLCGAYLLYRKMYKIGSIFTALMILLTTAELYFSISVANILAENTVTTYADFFNLFSGLGVEKQMTIMLMSLCSILNLLIKILTGAFANRWYFKHCKTEIQKIKKSSDNPKKDYETKGGVNLAIAVSVMAVVVALNELPTILSMINF